MAKVKDAQEDEIITRMGGVIKLIYSDSNSDNNNNDNINMAQLVFYTTTSSSSGQWANNGQTKKPVHSIYKKPPVSDFYRPACQPVEQPVSNEPT